MGTLDNNPQSLPSEPDEAPGSNSDSQTSDPESLNSKLAMLASNPMAPDRKPGPPTAAPMGLFPPDLSTSMEQFQLRDTSRMVVEPETRFYRQSTGLSVPEGFKGTLGQWLAQRFKTGDGRSCSEVMADHRRVLRSVLSAPPPKTGE